MVYPMLFTNYIYAKSTDQEAELSSRYILPKCYIHSAPRHNVGCACSRLQMDPKHTNRSMFEAETSVKKAEEFVLKGNLEPTGS